jgi:hypothetical protein
MSILLVNVHLEDWERNQSIIYDASEAVSELNKTVLRTRPVVGFGIELLNIVWQWRWDIQVMGYLPRTQQNTRTKSAIRMKHETLLNIPFHSLDPVELLTRNRLSDLFSKVLSAVRHSKMEWISSVSETVTAPTTKDWWRRQWQFPKRWKSIPSLHGSLP